MQDKKHTHLHTQPTQNPLFHNKIKHKKVFFQLHKLNVAGSIPVSRSTFFPSKFAYLLRITAICSGTAPDALAGLRPDKIGLDRGKCDGNVTH